MFGADIVDLAGGISRTADQAVQTEDMFHNFLTLLFWSKLFRSWLMRSDADER